MIVMQRQSPTLNLLIVALMYITFSSCHERNSENVDRSIKNVPKSNNVYASDSSVTKAYSILSSATHLDNLVAGERAPAGEHIWAFNVLLRSATNKEEFRKLFNSPGHYTHCYALLGMKISGDDYYKVASEIFKGDDKKYLYIFGCGGMEITNSEFVRLIDAGRIKPEYFKLEQFDLYLEDRERFLRNSDRYMIDTGFGL